MILYLDASALVKRYIAESGMREVGEAIAEAEGVGHRSSVGRRHRQRWPRPFAWGR